MLIPNHEVNLVLTLSKNCVLTDMTTHAAQGDSSAIDAPVNASFSISDSKFYVPNITWSSEDDDNALQQLKAGFKKTFKWNKYRSE